MTYKKRLYQEEIYKLGDISHSSDLSPEIQKILIDCYWKMVLLSERVYELEIQLGMKNIQR